MIAWLATIGWAAPVVCGDADAAQTLTEARIEEARAPVSHPELIPGLARSSERTGEELRAALADLCAPGGTLALTEAERWQGPDWSAHTFLLTRGEMRGCTLSERTVAITVGVRVGEKPYYALRSRLPPTRTPVGSCDSVPRFREEAVLDGEDGPVRLLLVTEHEGDEIVHAQVVVRGATPEGWSEAILVDPAPPRLLDGTSGPVLELTDRLEQKWVVAHGDRTGMPPGCQALPGQTVWTPEDGWTAHTGREALRLLASHGLWRMAGDDGWFLIVAQDDEEDVERLRARAERLEERSGKSLLILPSAWFPGLNPGFLVATLPPFASEEEAKAAHKRWWPRRQAYVKRAWTAPDPCLPAPRSP